MLENRRFTVRDLTGIVGISEQSVKAFLNDHLGLRKVKARMVPKSLNFEKLLRVRETMLSNVQDITKSIITDDESWIYAYDPETDEQSAEYRGKGEPKPKKTRQSRLC